VTKSLLPFKQILIKELKELKEFKEFKEFKELRAFPHRGPDPFIADFISSFRALFSSSRT